MVSKLEGRDRVSSFKISSRLNELIDEVSALVKNNDEMVDEINKLKASVGVKEVPKEEQKKEGV
jgi:hypothetical protein